MSRRRYAETLGSAPDWDSAGHPVNLLGAATDALEWLEVFRGWLREDKRAEMDEARARLGRCAVELREWIDKTVKEAADDEEARDDGDDGADAGDPGDGRGDPATGSADRWNEGGESAPGCGVGKASSEIFMTHNQVISNSVDNPANAKP